VTITINRKRKIIIDDVLFVFYISYQKIIFLVVVSFCV
jgi:hypothetical protein